MMMDWGASAKAGLVSTLGRWALGVEQSKEMCMVVVVPHIQMVGAENILDWAVKHILGEDHALLEEGHILLGEERILLGEEHILLGGECILLEERIQLGEQHMLGEERILELVEVQNTPGLETGNWEGNPMLGLVVLELGKG
jgi:hypothetical protein